ncbi:MAG: Rpn family recombination-promoting nuclease/putative transposase [Bryobacterales bacterium]|nr:Rpn family recombination-promoting nuclease/putative transposase [Bryobacterales bacterium]
MEKVLVDHDRMFKELLTTFFTDFLDLFFPTLAAELDRNSLEFLSQELYPDRLKEKAYRADLLVKARFRHQVACFLVHVEHQSTAPPSFPERFYRYYSAISARHGLPVYPIVIYSHDKPRAKQPSVHRVSFLDGEVLRFRYRVVQLNRLPWRRFLQVRNPVASALMSKMRIAERDRPRVKLECLRLMLTLRLDPARTWLISSFVDAYLQLSAAENERFLREAETGEFDPAEREEIVEYITTWERKGRELGLAEGRQEGLQAGAAALRGVLLDVLASRFGKVDPAVRQKLERIDSLPKLQKLIHKALTAKSPAALRLG